VVEVERHRQDHFVARVRDRATACTNAMLPAGRHHHPAAEREVDAVIPLQLVRNRLEQRPVAGAVLIAVRLGVGQRVARAVQGGLRRTVVHDALAEGNGARHLPDEVADHRHDRRLHGVHARVNSHGLHYIGSLRRPS
jgi:hypothetical protein